MDAQATREILRVLEEVPDPRRHNVRHKLIDLLTLGLMGVICGADDWVTVVEYAQAKESWLKTFLELPSGIPSHDTFGRVFARLDPDAFEQAFLKWTSALVDLSGGKLVAIDGKSIRRSFENAWDKAGMAHLVSAFVCANSLTFAQFKTDGKGHELEAIEKLLTSLNLTGAVVSIDAIGCNTRIAGLIQAAGADYLLQVKDNQPILCAKLQTIFAEAALEAFKGYKADTYQTVDGDHGRIETRKVAVLWDLKLLGALAKDWPGLKGLARVENTREVPGPGGMEKSTEHHYYLTTLDARRNAETILSYIRGHWAVENKLHWQLDVSFREDQRRIRVGHGAENFSRLCRMALNLIKNEKTRKVGVATARKRCGWDNAYLLKVLAG
jgi:predicted transposase YbfD/YdcC